MTQPFDSQMPTSAVPFELQFELTRRQRLVPHLKIWGPFAIIVPLVFVGLVVSIAWNWWAILIALAWLWFFKNYFRGLANVVFCARKRMDIQVNEDGLGFMDGGERWWVFLDGLIGIDEITPGLWTLRHHNGIVVGIPKNLLSEAQLAHLRSAMARGRTSEGMQAVIERGRRIVGLESQAGADRDETAQ